MEINLKDGGTLIVAESKGVSRAECPYRHINTDQCKLTCDPCCDVPDDWCEYVKGCVASEMDGR